MFTRKIQYINKKNVNIAGGKGSSLGEMTKSGLTVPPGFVILVSAFERFLDDKNLKFKIEKIINKIKPNNINSVEIASKQIRNLILDANIPAEIAKEIVKEYKNLNTDFVAVRSSATSEDGVKNSWAGELETYLNVTVANLLSAVKKCWSSLFTTRAIFYRIEHKILKSKVSVAVVIQKMVQSEVSGIGFTVHPVTKDHNKIVIEACFGLGEAIVGGLITPDTYIINKKDCSIEEINVSAQSMLIVKAKKGNINKKLSTKVGSKQKLSGKQILEIAKICLNIEKHYKKPQDIEWALEKGKFYITQSRPITTL